MTKIKCDDCKFEVECTDYGWDGCTKFTPKPSTKQTNEEWFTSLSTEEKAKAIVCLAHNASALAIEYHCADSDVEAISIWLKEVHK